MKYKDKKAWLKTLANISGNLSAGWYGLVLASTGFEHPGDTTRFY